MSSLATRKNSRATLEIDAIVADARKIFAREIGPDETELAAFESYVVRPLLRRYAKHPEQLAGRFEEIIHNGFYARDLCHYLGVACLAEGEDRPLCSCEINLILNNGFPDPKGLLYHFDTIAPAPGDRTVKGTLLCTTKDPRFLGGSEEFAVDRALAVYATPARVLHPEQLMNRTVKKYLGLPRDDLIELALCGDCSPDHHAWYRVLADGAAVFGTPEILYPSWQRPFAVSRRTA